MTPTPTKALVTFLQSDATLSGLVPGGIWQDIIPSPSKAPRPAIVFALESSAIDGEAMSSTGKRSEVWRFRYLLVVEGRQDAVDDIRDAADRLFTMVHRTQWSAMPDWWIERSSVVEWVERAYAEGEFRLLGVGGRVELVAERTA